MPWSEPIALSCKSRAQDGPFQGNIQVVLFFGSEEGAKAAVVMMSLVQSCREHRINPLLYLRDVLNLITTTPHSRVGELTPRG